MKRFYFNTFLIILSLNFQSFAQNWSVLLTDQTVNCIKAINTNELIASCSKGQILKSYDSGKSWYGKQPISVKDLLSVSVVNENIIFVSVENSVMKSTDRGETWTYIQPATVDATLKSIHFFDENTGIGVGSTIYKTVDGGKSWVRKLINTTYGFFTSVTFITTNTGFAVAEIPGPSNKCVIYKTTDGGENWTKMYNNTTEGLSQVYFINENIGFAVGGVTPTQNGEYFKSCIKRTKDGGSSWSNVLSGNGNIIRSICFSDINTGFAVTTNNFGYIDILKTQNSGLTWTKMNLNFSTISSGSNGLRTVICLDSNNIITGGDNGIIIKTSDAGNVWEINSQGLFSSAQSGDINSTCFVGSITAYACTPSSLYKSTNGGLNWKVISGSNFSFLSFIDNNTGYAVGTYGKVSKTIDGGLNWTSQTSSVTNNLLAVDFVNSSLGVAGGASGIIIKTTNGGVNWSKLTSGTQQDIISIKFTNTNIGYALTRSPGTYNGTVIKTTDGGTSWKQVRNIGALSMHVYHTDTLFLAGSNGNFAFSYDGGGNWTSKSTGVTKNLNAVLFTSSKNGWVAGDEGTIVKTTDGGLTWIKETALTTNNLKYLSLSSSGNVFTSGAAATLMVLPSKINNISGFANHKSVNSSFNVSPSIATNEIILKIEDFYSNNNLQYNIYDVNGSLIKTIKPVNSECIVSISELRQGMYFIQDNLSKYTLKFIKNR